MTFQQLLSGGSSRSSLFNEDLHNHPLTRLLRGSPRPNRTTSAKTCSPITVEEPRTVSDLIFETTADTRPAQFASSSSTSSYLSACPSSSSSSCLYEPREAQPKCSGGIAGVAAICKQIEKAKSRQHQEFIQMLQKHSEEQHTLLRRHNEEQHRLDESLQEALESCSQERAEIKQIKRINALAQEFIEKQAEIAKIFSKRMRDDRTSSDSEEAECDVSDALSESNESNTADTEKHNAPSAAAKDIRYWLAIQKELTKCRSPESKLEMISEHLAALTEDGKIQTGEIYENNYHRSLLEKTRILLDLCREGKARLGEAVTCFRNIDGTLFKTQTLSVYNSCREQLANYQEQAKRQRTS
jgi:hypothetical protein